MAEESDWKPERIKEEKKWIAKEKRYIKKPWWRPIGKKIRGPAEPPIITSEGEELPPAPSVLHIEKSNPIGKWETDVIDGTIRASRPVEIVQIDPETKEELRIIRLDTEENFISLPDTQRCFERLKSKMKDGFCKRVELAYACADETAGMLTPSQAAGIAGIGSGDAKGCVAKLQAEKTLLPPVSGGKRWAGEPYHIMSRETREKVRDKLEK